MKQIKVPEDMGFIVRTAGINRTKPEIQRDFQFMMRLWREIFKKPGASRHPFAFIRNRLRVRSLRDYLTQEIDEILVDEIETFAKCALI